MSKSGQVVGYARVSTLEQSTDIQIESLKAAGCTKIFSEKVTGTKRAGRKQLAEMLDYIREGDTVVITRLDRLARSMRDLQNVVHELEQKGVSLKSTEQPVDTSTASGRAFIGMLSVFSQFETDLRRERQAEGIAKAKAAGRYKGRAPTAMAKSDEVHRLAAEGLTKQAIADKLDIGVASVYRILKQAK